MLRAYLVDVDFISQRAYGQHFQGEPAPTNEAVHTQHHCALMLIFCNDLSPTATFTRLCNIVPASQLCSHSDCLYVCLCQQDEVNRVAGPKPYLESLSGEGSGEQQADEAWQYCRSRCNSPIQELFTGQLQTRTTCSCCGHHSLHFDEFKTLSLKFPHKLGSQLGLTLQVIAPVDCTLYPSRHH